WANLYPWDVAGDPAAADRIAGLGLAGVTLAAAYHSVRAVTPFHPRHRIVTRDAAVYYRADPANWRASLLRPPRARPALARRPAACAAGRSVAAAAPPAARAWPEGDGVAGNHANRPPRRGRAARRGAQRVRRRLPVGAVPRLARGSGVRHHAGR